MSSLLSQFADDLPSTQLFDTFYVPSESQVVFRCKNKDITVKGIVVEPFSFQLDSKWDSKALGTLADTHLLRGVDTILQDAGGVSINQPIFNRRTWSGTSPFGTTLRVRFVAVDSALEDVYLPVVRLAALLLPRAFFRMAGLAGLIGIFSIPGPAPFFSKTANDLLHTLEPNLGPNQNIGGDSVSVKFGNILNVQAAYITKVQGSFSKSLGPDGYPLAAEVYVSFEAMDSPFFVLPKSGDTVGAAVNNVFKCSNAMGVDVIEDIDSAVRSTYTKSAKAVGNDSLIDGLSGAAPVVQKTTIGVTPSLGSS